MRFGVSLYQNASLVKPKRWFGATPPFTDVVFVFVLLFAFVLLTCSVRQKESQDEIFCSELVADAYKRVGLLPLSTEATAYLPRHFSYEEELELLKGAYLDSPMTVDFGSHSGKEKGSTPLIESSQSSSD